jgi:hypothetical protein
MNGRPVITPSSRPSNDASLDMGVPPRSSRLYGRSGRAALTAGTLTPVGDHTSREDMERDVEVRHPDGYYPDVMTPQEHAAVFAARLREFVRPTDHEPREWYDEAERLRQSRLRRWQTPWKPGLPTLLLLRETAEAERKR